MVQPFGVVTLSISSSGCFPLLISSSAAPFTVCNAIFPGVVGAEADLYAALHHASDESEDISRTAGAQHGGGVHQFFVDQKRFTRLSEDLLDLLALRFVAAMVAQAGHGFTHGSRDVRHGPEYRQHKVVEVGKDIRNGYA